MTPLLFHAAATADMEGARAWYEAQRKGLGSEFLAEVDACMKRIQRQPDAYPIVERELRRALVRRFPYAIYYRHEDDGLHVVACLHSRRRPRALR